MKIEIDPQKYDERSREFLVWLERWIKNGLSTVSSINEEDKEEAIESLVWNMASLLDGSGNLEYKGKPMIPYLGFQVDEEEHVVFDDGKIALHELIDSDEEDWEDED